MGEQWWGLGPMSIPSQLGHLAVPIDICLREKNQMVQANFELCRCATLARTLARQTGHTDCTLTSYHFDESSSTRCDICRSKRPNFCRMC